MIKQGIKKYSLQMIGIFWLVIFLGAYQMGVGNTYSQSEVLESLNVIGKLDHQMQDYLLVANNKLFKGEIKPSDKIVIVGIDDESTELFGRFPWTRDIMAMGIEVLESGNPAAIGIDVLFTDYTDIELGADLLLAEAVEDAGNVVIASSGDTLITEEGITYSSAMQYPYPELAEVGTIAHINTIPENNVIRQTLNELVTDEGVIPSFAIALYEKYVERVGQSTENIESFKAMEGKNNLTYFDYPFEPSAFTYFSFAELFEEDFDLNILQDAVVLMGPYSIGMMDDYLTPLDKNTGTYGVAIWGIILQNLMDGTCIRSTFLLDRALLILICVLMMSVTKRFSPIKSGIVSILLGAVFVLGAQWSYSKGIRLSIAYALLLIVAMYLSYIMVKYLKEYFERKRITSLFGKYVEPEVVKKVIEEGESALQLGGSRRFVTLLFVDIRGFTPMSEKATPEQVVEILNEYLTLCATSIVAQKGTLDKFIGDATMAIYNAPVEIENHALAAVRSALAMKAGSVSLEKKLQERFGRSVQFGIGINSGYAVIGNIGCQFRMDYTAIGDTVNTAARLESNAKPGQILISQATYELVKDEVEVTPLDAIKVKGKEERIQIYQVEGLKSNK